MGVIRKVIKEGNRTRKPIKGDEVTIACTGNLYDRCVAPEKDYKGKQYV